MLRKWADLVDSDVRPSTEPLSRFDRDTLEIEAEKVETAKRAAKVNIHSRRGGPPGPIPSPKTFVRDGKIRRPKA